jgi:hypothetical protein
LKRDEVVRGNEGGIWSGEDGGDEVREGREGVPAAEGEGAGGFGVEGCSEGEDAEDLNYSLFPRTLFFFVLLHTHTCCSLKYLVGVEVRGVG